MIRKLAQILSFTMAVLCVTAPLAGAAQMVCTKDQVTVLSSPAPRPTQNDCVMAKGADGREVPVMVPKAKVGDTLDCTVDREGKMTCR